MNKQYKFSIIIPFYNSEKWLKKSIDSIINQSIGFENIQLILVNDGSDDKSLEICKQYKSKYENNIEILSKKNGGVASARNHALKHIKGRYVEFLDSDDYISNNTLEKVENFFEKNSKIINLISIPMFYFEGRNGEHYLNKKFKNGTTIIDLQENYKDIFVHINSVFIKSEIIKKYRFDENLITCEDAKLIIQLSLENPCYGIIDDCKYYYRLRGEDKNSLSQTAKKNKDWYIKQLVNYPLWIYDYSIQKIGYIPDFVKYIVASHLQWRFRNNLNIDNLLDKNEISIYNKTLLKALNPIDEYIIDELNRHNN